MDATFPDPFDDAPPRAEPPGSRSSEEWLPIVYEELRRLAHDQLDREAFVPTLQTTALVHEAYLRLLGGDAAWENRAHFFGAAARAMRRILIERARSRASLKKGVAFERTPLDDIDVARIDEEPGRLLALDAALEKLEALDARKAQVVMLRFFTGLSLEETAAALGISRTTVKEDWSFARAWLRRAIAPAG